MSSMKETIRERETADRTQLEEIVGAESVIDDSVVIGRYSSDMSFASTRRPEFVIQPRNADQVQELVGWANRTLMPLVPVSSGPPHFKGDTVPQQGGVIVDLSGMNRILRIDRRNRVAMIEPGVTFGDLQSALKQEGMRAMLPLAPRATKSVIGSYLEREPILVPKYHWDMSDPLCCVEVVFGNGDVFRTGAAAGPGTLEEQWASGQAQKSPVGPGPTDFLRVIQGAQGAMGIVTWATIRLELLPSMQQLFMVSCDNVEEIIDFVYRLQHLKLGDECLILDRLNLASILEQEAQAIERLRSTLPPYVLIFIVAGYDRFPEERVEYQTKDILEIAESYGIHPLVPQGVDTKDLLQALSTPCTEPYWKLRYRGNSVDIFFLTTLDRSTEFIEVMYEAAGETGFPDTNMGMYIQPVQQGRCCHMEFNLAYDPRNAGDAELARITFEKASNALMLKGAFFSRPYGIWSELIRNRHAENVIALRKVKKIFDTNNVMNPGRLFL
ncbi:MAG: FAD-binding oxidoreductase [Dehalococcoidia bacterium]|nr:MAG: FAD-binding oxidoreductase [Dehalococcoidia bacterium]